MAVYNYDPKDVVVICGGIVISGYADGSMVKLARDADAYAKFVGTDGETSRVRSRNKSGSLTITLAQTSPSNDALSVFAMLDETSNAGVFPVLVKDNSGRSVFASAAGWVKKLPDSEFGKEVASREWFIDLADLNMLVGGNATAGVI